MSIDATIAEVKKENSIHLDTTDEALRQIGICNACRYCEGFCAVFPAVHRQRTFTSGDITQLANLCHNCRGCYYACQYADPHEFNINIPSALANVRLESWEKFIGPSSLAQLFQRAGVIMVAGLIAAIALLFVLASLLQPESGSGFYAYLSHTMMISLFIPGFSLPIIVVWIGLKKYWAAVDGAPVKSRHLIQAAKDAASLKNLSGGQGQGCNFENEDRFSNQRRWAHQITVLGFLLCFASTAAGTILHYLFRVSAPYPLFSIPKFFGLPGGILLSIGCAWLVYLKCKALKSLSATGVWGGEMAFVLVLGATGATGLTLYFATGTEAVQMLLAIHLGTVLAFFLTMPYSKMVHGFFRMAALVREAQLGEKG